MLVILLNPLRSLGSLVPTSLVPKLHLGTHLFRQLHWPGRRYYARSTAKQSFEDKYRSQVQLGNEGILLMIDL